MSSKTEQPRAWLDRMSASPFALLLVLAAAIVVRAPGLAEWSLWEDEETSLHFSQQLQMPFPSYFPLFFVALRGVYEVTGVSIPAGRTFCAALGVLSIVLTYLCAGRMWSRTVGLLAALFVALSVGHLFWSQSIRYYILLFVFQLLSLYWFYDGFERGRWWELWLANLALGLGLWTHFSGALLIPVFVGYLMLAAVRRESGGGYTLKGYLHFLVPFLIVLALFAWQFIKFRTSLASLVTGPTSLVRLALQVVIYFGAPAVALAALAPLVARQRWADRRLMFFLVVAVVPVMELLVIAALNLTIVTWYYAFFALFGFAVLAGAAVEEMLERGYRTTGTSLALVAVLASLPLLIAYHTVLYGDRPRWKEATARLREQAGVDLSRPGEPQLYANVPGIVAHYLGVPAGATMGNPLVKELPARPPAVAHPDGHWYLVEVSAIAPDYAQWLAKNCELRGKVVAGAGPKDRTLFIYHCRPQLRSAR